MELPCVYVIVYVTRVFVTGPPPQEQTFWQEIRVQRYNVQLQTKNFQPQTHSHKPTGSKANSTLNQNFQYVTVVIACRQMSVPMVLCPMED